MNIVKTYPKVNSKEEHIHFAISRMENIFVKRKGVVDEPHRHDFYTVLIINKANGLHKIDFNTYHLSNNQLFFVAPGQVHQVIEKEQSFGFAMTFSIQFLIENAIPLSFIDGLNLFQNYGQSPPLFPAEEKFKNIEHFAEKIFELSDSDAKMKSLSIGAYLKLLLIECNNICSISQLPDVHAVEINFIQSFKNAVDQNFRTEHSASFYANLFNITTDHLNRTVKAKIGKTAKNYIQSRIITEAKRMLYFTSLSNKEVGYELGFNEPSNFSAFFKKQTNISPSEFKSAETVT